MGLIRGELEDLAFRYLEPEAFLELQKKVASKQKVFDKFLFQKFRNRFASKMVENGIPAEVQGTREAALLAAPEKSRSSSATSIRSTIFWRFAWSPTR